MIDVTELHWMAGVFEGEGSVRINKPTARNAGALLVDLANTDPALVTPFHQMWGGTVATYPALGARNAYSRWRAVACEAEAFLLAMYPLFHSARYLRRCVLGLDFQSQKSRDPRVNRTAEYRARQWSMYEQMAGLNLRGADAAGLQRRGW